MGKGELVWFEDGRRWIAFRSIVDKQLIYRGPKLAGRLVDLTPNGTKETFQP